MPLDSDCNIRIANSNLLKNSLTLSYPQIAVTTADVTNVFNNCLNDKRQEYYSFTGYFDIGIDNFKIYINDGSDKEASVSITTYTTPALLATAVQTALNGVSSNWTVSYASGRFTISNTGSVTLRLSSTANAVWDTIGFTGVTDITGTSFPADEIRNHTLETISIDFGTQVSAGFCGMIGPSGEEFSFSDAAVITLYGNNLNDITTAPLSIALSVDDDGAYAIPDEVDSYYRYFWITVDDKRNPNYTPKISNLFLGEYISIDFNITPGFNLGKIDRTVRLETESGILFHDTKNRYWTFDVNFGIVSKTDLTKYLQLWDEMNINNPFYISLDPRLNITESRRYNTKFVYFEDRPQFQHLFYDKYSASMAFREAL